MIESDRDRNVRIASAGFDLVVALDGLANKHTLSPAELVYLLSEYMYDHLKKIARRRRKKVVDVKDR